MADLKIGTSAFTAAGWPGAFYPEGLPEREYLTYYATKFDTVEVDSTFYRTPALTTVQGWYSKTPSGFIFARALILLAKSNPEVRLEDRGRDILILVRLVVTFGWSESSDECDKYDPANA